MHVANLFGFLYVMFLAISMSIAILIIIADAEKNSSVKKLLVYFAGSSILTLMFLWLWLDAMKNKWMLW